MTSPDIYRPQQNNQDSQRKHPFADLKRHHQPEEQPEGLLALPDDEFDRTVNTLQNFDVEEEPVNMTRVIEYALLFGVPLGVIGAAVMSLAR